MTDRKLLELAAKAAGYEVDFNRWLDCGAFTLYWNVTTNKWWNPLALDGDALRLAVQLGLFTLHHKLFVEYLNSEAFEMDSKDRTTATRRAIVRAAAEIGKGMK